MFRYLLVGLVAWWISTGMATAQSAKVRATYPVGDLVVPIEDHSFRADKARGDTATARDANAERLIKLITTTVAKDSWQGNRGTGTIQYFPMGLALVVENRRDVQEQVARFLAELRRLQDVQIAVELRL